MAFTLSSAVASVHAQEEQPQPLQEVFQTELVYPQERGEWQITFGPGTQQEDGRTVITTPVSVEFGLTDRWQVGFETSADLRRDDAGDLASTRAVRFGTKYSFLNIGGSNFHSAVGVEAGRTGGSDGTIDVEPFVCFARDFPTLHRLQIFSQMGFGYERARDTPGATRSFEWSAGLFVPAGRVCFTGEVSRGDGESGPMFTPGVVWRVARAWEVGVGLPRGIAQRGHAGAALNLVFEF